MSIRAGSFEGVREGAVKHMADEKVKASKENLEGIEDAGRSDRSSSSRTSSGKSTATKPNGGTRSSPPRVGGTGQGEVRSVKASDASKAKDSVRSNDRS